MTDSSLAFFYFLSFLVVYSVAFVTLLAIVDALIWAMDAWQGWAERRRVRADWPVAFARDRIVYEWFGFGPPARMRRPANHYKRWCE